jgi:hypothetical protein
MKFFVLRGCWIDEGRQKRPGGAQLNLRGGQIVLTYGLRPDAGAFESRFVFNFSPLNQTRPQYLEL